MGKVYPYFERSDIFLKSMLRPDVKVRVYRNLHKGCFSVQQRQRVIAHVESIYLKDVRFIVLEKGRQKVLKTKRKNVHAFVEGTVCSVREADKCRFGWESVYYDPYKQATWQNNLGQTINKAQFADLLHGEEVLIWD